MLGNLKSSNVGAALVVSVWGMRRIDEEWVGHVYYGDLVTILTSSK
jgi:hypothetical protein